MKRFLKACTAVFGSRRFFIGVLIFFVAESLWVACSADYPMAFDEDFHLGIIKIYSHHWLPFLSAQPQDAAQFGPVQHDPSYLYHYLMSFPYRLLTHLTASQTLQIICLRCINIALFALAIVLFRRLLRRTGTSPAFTNVALLLLVLIPIVPLLAGQINYDNLMLPVVAWVCLLTLTIYNELREGRVDVRSIALLAVACMLGSLVKYPFLPIAVVAVLFVTGTALWMYRRRWAELPGAVRAGYRRLSKRMAIALLAAVIISAGLFVQRYGVNLALYHNPVPTCDTVLNEDECLSYGPWARDYELEQAKDTLIVNKSPVQYSWWWVQALHMRLFFMINGPKDGYHNYLPMPIIADTAAVIIVGGTLAVIVYAKRTFRGQPYLWFLLGASVVYGVSLWLVDYGHYMDTGNVVAVNGRYLLPVLLPLAIIYGRALSCALRRWPLAKPVMAGLAIVLFLQGGGVISFIVRSNQHWYWQTNSLPLHANNGARRVLAPLVVEGKPQYYY